MGTLLEGDPVLFRSIVTGTSEGKEKDAIFVADGAREDYK
jgi:hypothetical protein